MVSPAQQERAGLGRCPTGAQMPHVLQFPDEKKMAVLGSQSQRLVRWVEASHDQVLDSFSRFDCLRYGTIHLFLRTLLTIP